MTMLCCILSFLILCGGTVAEAPPPPPSPPWQSLVSEAEADSILSAHGVPADRPFVVFLEGFGEHAIFKSFGTIAGKGVDRSPAAPSFTLKRGEILPLSEARTDTLYEMDGGYFARVAVDRHGSVDTKNYIVQGPTIRGFFIAPEDWSLGVCFLGDYQTEGQALADRLYSQVGLSADSRVRHFWQPVIGMKEGRRVLFVAYRGDEGEVAGRVVFIPGRSFDVEKGAVTCEP